MRTLILKESTLQGEIAAPPSKAYTHRSVIAASLSEGTSRIENPLVSQDTEATIRVATQYGSEVNSMDNILIVKGRHKIETPRNVIDCNESAATIRFIAPILAKADGISVLTGRGGLLKRPMKPLIEALHKLGVKSYSTRGDGFPPLVVFGGGVKGGKTVLRGDISSQFLSGLLFVAPLAESDVTISISTLLESKPFVDMTLYVLRKHGIRVDNNEYKIFDVKAGQKYLPHDHVIEGDFSSAAFLMAAAAATKSIMRIKGLNPQSLQGDRKILEILAKMSVKVKQLNNDIIVDGSASLKEVEIDATDIPDLVPIIAALACFAEGKTLIRNVRRLRFKESDRVSSIIKEFSKTGATLRIKEDNLLINGGNLKSASFHSHNDHRIAMACSILGLGIRGKSRLISYECIKKSYPSFYQDIISLGAEIIGI